MICVVLRDGEVSGQDGLGVWWSLSKTVIAALALRHLDLDAAVDWPGRPTVRQLLRHEGGVPDYGARPDYRAAVAAGGTPWTAEEMLDRTRGSLFAPGTGWAYSNVGYLLVRRALEARAPLDRLVRDLMDPLGLRETRLATTRADLRGMVGGDVRYDPAWVYHGTLVGPASEAARWVRSVLTGADAPAMTDGLRVCGPLPGRPWIEGRYGLGTMCGDMRGVGRAWGHSGVGPFSVSACYHLPDAPGAPTVCAFAPPASEGAPEAAVERAVRAAGLAPA
ncbi:beta-lactamase family protein [Jannaschia sp. Os4]|uniref:serine hydrolase n=1 Tax=Jannaschia sp. Os4 TaxID=2807617 RepID=UPI001939325A|nr:beta-lactamase family protein [Jannaschia sp. Os4]